MTSPTSTYHHDYRWTTSGCLAPRAEALSENCEVRQEGCQGGQGDKEWCGYSPPPKPSFSWQEPHARVCADLVPPSGLTDRPWCQRGPLVPLLNPATITTPVQPRLQPPGCQEQSPASARPWCDADTRGYAAARIPSARVGAAPQQDTSRYNQPDQYLRKLCEKYPKPTAAITATPRDELVRRVYADRYRTTYQTDYCKNGQCVSGVLFDDFQMGSLMRRPTHNNINGDDAARNLADCDSHEVYNKRPLLTFTPAPTTPVHVGVVNGHNGGSYETQQYVNCKCGCGCKMTVQSGGDVPTPRLRPLACRPAAVSHNVHFSCCNPRKKPGQVQEEVGPPEKILPWASEYTESIGRTGQLIIEQRLLHPKRKN